MRNVLTQHIRQCGDIERLVSKIPLKKINPRELQQIARGLQHIAQIRQIGLATGNDYLHRMADALNPCQYIMEKILQGNQGEPAGTAFQRRGHCGWHPSGTG